MIQYQISWADMVSKKWEFCLKFESSSGRKDIVLTIWGSDTLSEELPIILIHLREVMKHSSSNDCMSLGHSGTFPRLIWCSKLYFCLKFECLFGKNNAVTTIGGSDIMLSKALWTIPIYIMEIRIDSQSNGCLYLQYNITFHRLMIQCPKLVILI